MDNLKLTKNDILAKNKENINPLQNESICDELVKNAAKKSENLGVATFRENQKNMPINPSIQSARGNSLNQSKISKSDIRIETNGKIEDQLCVICYVKRTDAVLIPCCHGGICYECAKRIAEQKAVCHFCRSEIQQVIKIDLDENTDFFRISDKSDITLTTKMYTKT